MGLVTGFSSWIISPSPSDVFEFWKTQIKKKQVSKPKPTSTTDEFNHLVKHKSISIEDGAKKKKSQFPTPINRLYWCLLALCYQWSLAIFIIIVPPYTQKPMDSYPTLKAEAPIGVHTYCSCSFPFLMAALVSLHLYSRNKKPLSPGVLSSESTNHHECL